MIENIERKKHIKIIPTFIHHLEKLQRQLIVKHLHDNYCEKNHSNSWRNGSFQTKNNVVVIWNQMMKLTASHFIQSY